MFSSRFSERFSRFSRFSQFSQGYCNTRRRGMAKRGAQRGAERTRAHHAEPLKQLIECYWARLELSFSARLQATCTLLARGAAGTCQLSATGLVWNFLSPPAEGNAHVARTRVRQIAPSRREGGMKCEELAKFCSTRLHGEQSPSNYHWNASACNLARGPGTTFVSRLVFVDCVRQLAKKRSKLKFRKRTQSRSQTSWLPSFPIPKPPSPGIQS